MRSFIGLVMCMLSLQAGAEDGNLGVLGRVGTLGLGAEVGRGLGQTWAVRFGVNALSVDRDITESDVTYDASLDLRSAGLTFDWHPAGAFFRLSAGAFYNKNEFSVLGRPTGGSFEINGRTYTAAEIGSLDGKVSFSKFAPYLGIGLGNVARKGFAYSVDVGVLYQKSPKVDLNVRCGNTVQCTQLTNDVAAERTQLQSDLDSFKFWPVIQIGLGYVF